MIWMDIVFEFTFGVNYKSYLPFLNAEKKKIQNFSMWPVMQQIRKNILKNILSKSFFQIRKFLYFF